jgi:hypothetical protein
VSENGDSVPQNTIILTLTKEPWQLDISGSTENLNVGLAMLEEAKRVLEMKWRVGAASAEVQEAKQGQQELQRVRTILDRNQRRQ